MTFNKSIALLALVISSNVWTSPSAWAFSQTLAADTVGTYKRVERQYVLTPYAKVEALCDPGDTLISSVCSGRDSFTPDFGPEVFVEKSESAPANGVACQALNVHVNQIVKIESLAVCKKGNG
jgi:hypothetical protein